MAKQPEEKSTQPAEPAADKSPKSSPPSSLPPDKAAARPTTRLGISRYEREQRTRRVVVIGAAVVGAATVLLIAAAVLQRLVIEPNRVVASVGGQPITVTELQKRMRFDQALVENRYSQLAQQVQEIQQQAAQGDESGSFLLQFYQQQLQQLASQTTADSVAQQALDDMITDKLVRQEAIKRSLTISPDDVEKSVEESQGFYRVTLTPFPTDTAEPTASPTLTATATPQATATTAASNTPAATLTYTPVPATATPVATATSGVITGTVSASSALTGTATATRAPVSTTLSSTVAATTIVTTSVATPVTSTGVPTNSVVNAATLIPTRASTATAPLTATLAPTNTRVPSATVNPTTSATATVTGTVAPTSAATRALSATIGSTSVVSSAVVISAPASMTSSTVALTPTLTNTATVAATSTPTATRTSAPTATPTLAATASTAPITAPVSALSPTTLLTESLVLTSSLAATPTVAIPTLIPPTSTPRLQPTTITQGDYEVKRDRFVKSYDGIGFNETDLRGLIESNLYAEKLREIIAKEVVTQTPHYQFDYIRFNVITAAQTALSQLNSGALTFEALISQTNAVTQPAPIGFGAVGQEWTSASAVEQQYGNAALAYLESGELNKPSTVITATDASYLVLPKAREVRPLSDNELQTAQQKAYTDWLDAAKADTNLVKREVDPTTVIPQTVQDRATQFAQLTGQTQ